MNNSPSLVDNAETSKQEIDENQRLCNRQP